MRKTTNNPQSFLRLDEADIFATAIWRRRQPSRNALQHIAHDIILLQRDTTYKITESLQREEFTTWNPNPRTLTTLDLRQNSHGYVTTSDTKIRICRFLDSATEGASALTVKAPLQEPTLSSMNCSRAASPVALSLGSSLWLEASEVAWLQSTRKAFFDTAALPSPCPDATSPFDCTALHEWQLLRNPTDWSRRGSVEWRQQNDDGVEDKHAITTPTSAWHCGDGDGGSAAAAEFRAPATRLLIAKPQTLNSLVWRR
jgi:hypothetical protein